VPWYPTTDEVALSALWPRYDRDTVEAVIFDLGYTQHGGSGLGWSRIDVLEMEWELALKALERLRAAREREAEALRAAHRKGRKG
jgi:hypothetical protein